MAILYTSLAEIRSYNPCPDGWRSIYAAQRNRKIREMDEQFPLIDCLDSNTALDVIWLLRMRKTEVSIAVAVAQQYIRHIETQETIIDPYNWAACKNYAKLALKQESPFWQANSAIDCIACGYRAYSQANQDYTAKQILRAAILSYQANNP